MHPSFNLIARDPKSSARVGALITRRGVVQTPVFMPVGTQATVKAMTPWELDAVGAQIILGNTYHLHVRPGEQLIEELGGLHQFMQWQKPILTDSGGFQVFSLAKLRRVTPEGVYFQNHLDGTPTFISPERSMEIQQRLGSDVVMAFDECPPHPCSHEDVAKSLELTLAWAQRCRTWWDGSASLSQTVGVVSTPTSNAIAQQHKDGEVDATSTTGETPVFPKPLVFGIVQGGSYPDLRRESAEALVKIGFDGYAVGGVSVGEPEEEMFAAVESAVPYLPEAQARYAMGLGTPPQMLEMVARGVDMFDCVLPTRLARNGTAFTACGTINLKNACYAKDSMPIEEGCGCDACRQFSRAYLRHLVKAEEILGLRLVTIHNLYFYLQLMWKAREAILGGVFDDFRKEFVANYRARER